MTVGNVQSAAPMSVSTDMVRDVYAAQGTQRVASEVQDVHAKAQSRNQESVDVQADEQSIRLTEEQTGYIAEELNDIMRHINVNLEFQYHKEVNFMSVRMLDKKTHEVLREIPSEDMVKHMIHVRDWIGAFLDKRA